MGGVAMPVFYFLVLLAAVGLWVLLSFVFIPLGRFLFNTYKNTKDIMEKEDPISEDTAENTN